MSGVEAVSGMEAITTVGLVLAEAVVLYVGYGALGGLVESAVLDALGGD
ncbi:DUF7512 family protein [Halogeometricum luteum]|uniref:Uncharacterized protein n=1 Tax=Halogeometricum luteum TaxID=2950537 RepID=A0ABU2FX29_9EURY|nr:hypothetical protein [Halogeometricum sp. S3BR5-2]MDS0292609.1 hypothetical protein [Halogeometricum sp. S3BR5-2]